MSRIDAYATLGVARDAPDFVIQAAYRAYLKRYHPDHYRGDDARQRTEDVLEAFRLIGNNASRIGYDREQPQMGDVVVHCSIATGLVAYSGGAETAQLGLSPGVS